MTSRKDAKTGEARRPAKNTLHQEIVCLRQVLKCANRQGWIHTSRTCRRPTARRARCRSGDGSRPRNKQAVTRDAGAGEEPAEGALAAACEQFHDYVLFMANTGLRPDEAARLQFRDVTIVEDEDTDERILEIEVRGKRGVGYCKSMPGAVLPFKRLRSGSRSPVAGRRGGGRQPSQAVPRPRPRNLEKAEAERSALRQRSASCSSTVLEEVEPED